MDATRARRTKDRARREWYARHRQWRFARFLGVDDAPAWGALAPSRARAAMQA